MDQQHVFQHGELVAARQWIEGGEWAEIMGEVVSQPSDGELRVKVRAVLRDPQWGPRYVAGALVALDPPEHWKVARWEGPSPSPYQPRPRPRW